MDSPLTLGNVKFKTISTPNRYVGGPFVDFEIQVVGASDWQGVSTGDHHLRITFGSQTVDEVFEGYQLRKINRSFSPTELSPANNLIRFESIDDLNVGVDRTALAYMKIRYPQSLSLSNANYYEFYLEDANLQSAQYLELLSSILLVLKFYRPELMEMVELLELISSVVDLDMKTFLLFILSITELMVEQVLLL